MEKATKNSLDIQATQEEIYQALTDPRALENWQAPGDMTAKIHHFDLRVGGGYEMSLFYPESERKMTGKTATNEDKFTARFIELIPNKKIVQAINFASPNQDLKGEMTMEVILESVAAGTSVTISFKNIPAGIKKEDNEAGTISSLKKLANYVRNNKN